MLSITNVELDMNNSIIIEQINRTEKSNIAFDGRDSLQSKYFRGARWLKIFYHNIAAGPFPTTDKVMLSLESDRFSVLKYVNEMFLYEGKYEMMIECPATANSEAGFVWWKQSKFPHENDPIENIGKDVEGFLFNPDSTWTQSVAGDKFTGLAKSNNQFSLFDCTSSSNTNWYWAIGMTKFISNNRIPCYNFGDDITLWIRVPLDKFILKDGGTKIFMSLLICFFIH